MSVFSSKSLPLSVHGMSVFSRFVREYGHTLSGKDLLDNTDILCTLSEKDLLENTDIPCTLSGKDLLENTDTLSVCPYSLTNLFHSLYMVCPFCLANLCHSAYVRIL
jgi:hypothetical protein